MLQGASPHIKQCQAGLTALFSLLVCLQTGFNQYCLGLPASLLQVQVSLLQVLPVQAADQRCQLQLMHNQRYLGIEKSICTLVCWFSASSSSCVALSPSSTPSRVDSTLSRLASSACCKASTCWLLI